MPLELFKRKYVNHLHRGVGANLERYGDKRPWAGKAPPEFGPIRLSSGLEPAAPLDMILPTGPDQKDLENAVVIHQAFPNMNPVQARDPRLWTRLTHVDCWAYMRKRWDVTSKTQWDDAKKARYVLEHYFVPRQSSLRVIEEWDGPAVVVRAPDPRPGPQRPLRVDGGAALFPGHRPTAAGAEHGSGAAGPGRLPRLPARERRPARRLLRETARPASGNWPKC